MVADIFARALQCECDRETQQQATLFDFGAGTDGAGTDKNALVSE